MRAHIKKVHAAELLWLSNYIAFRIHYQISHPWKQLLQCRAPKNVTQFDLSWHSRQQFLLIHHCRKPYLVCASMCSWRRWKRTRTHGSPSQLLSSRRRSESSQIISRCYPALPTSALIPHFRQSLTMIFYPIYKGMHAFPVDLTAVVSARGAELWTPCTTEKLWQAGRVGFSEGPCVVYCPAAEVGRAGKLSVIKLTTLDQNVRMCCIIKHFITDAAWGNKYCQSFRSYICYFYESRLFILYII